MFSCYEIVLLKVGSKIFCGAKKIMAARVLIGLCLERDHFTAVSVILRTIF